MKIWFFFRVGIANFLSSDFDITLEAEILAQVHGQNTQALQKGIIFIHF